MKWRTIEVQREVRLFLRTAPNSKLFARMARVIPANTQLEVGQPVTVVSGIYDHQDVAFLPVNVSFQPGVQPYVLVSELFPDPVLKLIEGGRNEDVLEQLQLLTDPDVVAALEVYKKEYVNDETLLNLSPRARQIYDALVGINNWE